MTTIRDVTVDIRDSNLTRISRIPDYDLVGFHLVRRFNNVGYWEINISNSSPIVEDLTTPGNGIVVQLYDENLEHSQQLRCIFSDLKDRL